MTVIDCAARVSVKNRWKLAQALGIIYRQLKEAATVMMEWHLTAVEAMPVA